MANRYIIMGATYNGDGTTSAEATSNGGVGAWNHGAATTSGGGAWTAIPYFEGTAPPAGSTLPAGTTVFVRTKDAAGNNITVTKAATTTLGAGSGVATESSPITWVFDAGVVWSGVSGVVTVSTTAAAAGITVRAYNNLVATNYNLVLSSTVGDYGNNLFFSATNCITKDIKIDTSANNTGGGAGGYHQLNGGVYITTWFNHGAVTYSVIHMVRESDTTLISPKISILGPLYFAADETAVFDTDKTLSSKFSIYGGEITSGFTGMPICKTSSYASNFESYGFKYPPTMPLFVSALFSLKTAFSATGNDGLLGSTYVDYFFTYSSRYDGYYPKLNAQLELSSNAPWSYAIYPYRTTPNQPVKVSLSKVWTQPAAVKTVTLELLWPNSMAAPTSANVWMTVQYTDDATGGKVTQNTLMFPGAALTASSAGWSASTYGASNFSKLKLALTTTFSIRQDTEVMATFFSSPKSVSSTDIIILCPDPVFG